MTGPMLDAAAMVQNLAVSLVTGAVLAVAFFSVGELIRVVWLVFRRWLEGIFDA